MSEFCGFFIILDCNGSVGFHAGSEFVAEPKIAKGGRIVLFGGEPVPFDGL